MVEIRARIQLAEDEEIFLDERLGISPSLIAGGLLFVGLLFLLFRAGGHPGSMFIAAVLAFVWLFFVPFRRLIITDKRAIFRAWLVFSVPLKEFREARAPNAADLLRPPSSFLFLHWFLLPGSLLFKDVASIVFKDFFAYVAVPNRRDVVGKFNKVLEIQKKREAKEKPPEEEIGDVMPGQPKGMVLKRALYAVVVATLLYFFLTSGFLTLVFASPMRIGDIKAADEGRYVRITGELVYFESTDVPLLGETTLWIREEDKVLHAVHRKNVLLSENKVWEKTRDRYPVTLSGKLKIKENMMYLEAHFLDRYPDRFFLYSLILLAHIFLTNAGIFATRRGV